METFSFMQAQWPTLWTLIQQHVFFVGLAVLIAIATGVPIGIWISFNKEAAKVVLYIAGVIMTIPSIALFGIMIPILSVFGHGIGTVPAVIALVLYSQLPIIRNTHAAIVSVDPNIIDAGTGMGMNRSQLLWKVRLPMALSVIFAGVRVAVAMSIGIGAIAAIIGAGGLGQFIYQGIDRSYDAMVNSGAFTLAVMAITVDYLFERLETALVSPGLREEA